MVIYENNENNFNNNDKPTLLKAIEIILQSPEDIKKEVYKLKKRYYRRYSSKMNADKINKKIAKKIVSNYSYFTSFVGGATALAGVVPGLGTVISTFGGATADIALTMKFEIEMVMAIAFLYGHDIEIEEEKRLCLIIAGLGAITKAFEKSSKRISSRAFTKMVQQYLRGSTLKAVKQIFKKIGIRFTRKSLEKSIPFGVGVIVGASVNKGLTYYIGLKAIDYFEEN